jgi:hypothetical protein
MNVLPERPAFAKDYGVKSYVMTRIGEHRVLACKSRHLAETGCSTCELWGQKMLPAGLPATTGWQPVLPHLFHGDRLLFLAEFLESGI